MLGAGGLAHAQTIVPVCERTPQVRDAIVAKVAGVTDCSAVTAAHLAGITVLDASSDSISSLKAGDFAGLSSLVSLQLENNQLTTLPDSVFAGLSSLKYLRLFENQLTTLPASVFAGLSSLTTLNLHSNQLTTLPASVFAGLSSLTSLNLSYNQLTTLPASVFAGLSSLTTLYLEGNALTTLPDSVFAGLSSLTTLWLNGNSVNPMPLSISLEKVGNSQFKAVAPAGAPFVLTLPVSVSAGGMIDGGASTITIPAGAVESAPLGVTREAGVVDAVTVDIETLPGLPGDHVGYELQKDTTALPLTVVALSLQVCERTPQVRDAIVAAVAGVTDCSAVTAAHLAGITELDASFKSIRSLMAGDFGGLSSLTTLDLFRNQLTTLPASVFGGLSALTELGLSLNQLTTLPASVFAGLNSLTELGLSDNQLTTLPASVFAGPSSLTELYLGHNQLTTLPASVFAGLSSLTTLNLSYNQLTTLPASVFAGLSSLGSLQLEDNQLTTLPDGVFAGLSSLWHLGLNSNQFTTLPAGVFGGLSSLGLLELHSNQLTTLPAGVFAGLSSLTVLKLHSNQLTTLPAGVFAGLSSLGTLSLQGNSVDPLPLSISLEKVGNSQFKAVAPAGAPLVLTLPVSVSAGGMIDGGASTITIPAGAVESPPLGVTREAGVVDAVTVDIETLPGLPVDHVGYELQKDTTALPLVTHTNQVCERTPQVRDAIVAAVAGVTDCSAVTAAHLAGITELDASSEGIWSLMAGDFAGLSSLTQLDLRSNQLGTLPDSVFAGLSSLTQLDLSDNRLTTLPDGVFAGLSSLTTLDLNFNRLTTLPAGVFAGLSSLTTLDLNFNRLTTLPAGVFAGLSSLTWLNLSSQRDLRGNKLTILPAGVFAGLSSLTTLDLSLNQLTTLPAGVFAGLSSLGTLSLQGNSVDPLPLSISLEKVGDSQFKAVAPAGAPFVLTLPVSVSAGGMIEGGASAITIPAGAVESAPLGVTREAGVESAVTVDIGTPPALPDGHTGYELQKDTTTLPLVTHTSQVCERTPQVRDAIVAAVAGVTDCSAVTAAHLAGITELDASSEEISSLMAGDFAGLDSLEYLYLDANLLSTLPASVFAGLSSLTQLDLGSNQLTTLPVGVFAGLSSLAVLDLSQNQLTTLPVGVFAGLSSLFWLNLIYNQLTTLPASVFAGLSSLTALSLQGNSVDPLPLSISLEKVGDSQFKAVAPTAAPFALTLPVSVVNGMIDGGATTLTIPAGAVESPPLGVTREAGVVDAVTVDIGTLPGLPEDHTGYVLTRSPDLPLEVIASRDATLGGLTLSEGTLDPPFTSDRYAYEASVAHPVDTITVTATATDTANATIEFLDASDAEIADADGNTEGHQVALDVGANVIKVEVTAAEGMTTQTYTLTVTRVAQLSVTAPDPPTSLSATANGQTQIDLSWTAPTSTGGATITGYKIEWSADGSDPWTALNDDTESTDTTYADTGLTAGTTRHYRVSAINSVGAGAASSVASTTTDVPVTVTVADTLSTLEDGGAAEIAVTATTGIDAPPPRPFEIQLVTADGTATAFEDYIPLNTLVRFAVDDFSAKEINGVSRWQATRFLLVPLYSDADIEDDETFTATLIRPEDLSPSIVLGTPKTVTVTILNDDGIDATLSDLAVNDGTNDLTLDPTFATDTTSYAASVANDIDRITVTPETTDDSATVEYLDASDAAITDADGSTEGHQVALDVGANVIKVEVTAADSVTTQTYTLTVTRAAQLSVVSIAADTTRTTIDIGTASFTLTRTGPTTDTLTVDVEVTEEYRYVTGPLPTTATFAADESEAKLEFNRLWGRGTSETGDLTVTILDGTGYDVSATAASASIEVVVLDPVMTFTLDAAEKAVAEAVDSFTVTVTAETAEGATKPQATQGMEVILSPRDGTATVGDDFESFSTHLVFAPDDFALSGTVYRAEKTQTVAIVDDDLFEPPVDGDEESFTVVLERTPGTRARIAIPDTTDAMVVTIEDDDKPDWKLTVEPDTIAEAGTESSAVTVLTGGKTFATDQTITLSLAGTATAPDDFTLGSKSLTLTAGDTLVTATITAVDDTLDDDDETILVTASHDGATIGEQSTITIADDDAAVQMPNLSLTPSPPDPTPATASSVQYTITFEGQWTTTATPGSVPGRAHFSPLIGGVHNDQIAFLTDGGTASVGVESMAELGLTATLSGEISGNTNTLRVLHRTGNIDPTASATLTATLTTDHPRVTLLTMIAPSPDWFVGVSGLSLLDGSGEWVASRTVDLYAWDAGTEDGTEFDLDNVATSPQGVITNLRGVGKFSNEKIATLILTRGAVTSTNATLSALTLSDGTLDPAFASDTYAYTADVANSVDTITVTPMTSNDSATVAYLDENDAEITDADGNTEGQQVDLAVGANTINVKVTAEDAMTTETYTVVVTRAAPVAATITDVAITSDPDATGPDDDTYAIGDTVKVTVTFSDTVTVDTTNGSPTLELDFEGDPKSAAYDMDASSGAAVVFAYTVVENDFAGKDGIAIEANQLVLNTGTIRTGGADADLNHAAVDADPTHLVYGVRPEFKDAVVDRTVNASALVLSFGENLDALSTPANSAFTVSSNTVTDVAISGAEVTLTLGTAVAAGDTTVTVTYTAPQTDPIRNPVGNDAEGFMNEGVEVRNPLTAAWSLLPASHDGLAEFKARIRFSDPIATSLDNLVAGVAVNGGSIANQRRVSGDRAHIELDVQPAGNGDVTFVLPATQTACTDAGAICTADGRLLSERLGGTVIGPSSIGVTVEPTAVSATEGGATGSYTVVLKSQPTDTVTVAVADTSADLSASPTTLKFTTANWNTAQTVTVTAVDDDVDEDEEDGILTHTATSTDGSYDGATVADVTVTITDDDTRGVAVSSATLTFTEGGSGTYTVALESQPTGTVTVTVGDTSDDITASPETLTFTTANWNTAQTVTVTADDDNVAEGEETATLTHAVSGYGTVTSADSVTVTIADNDTAGVTVNPTAVTATEGGATGSYTVVLKSQPTDTVTVTVGDTSDDIAASPETLTFTTANWNTAQTVTVTAVDDDSMDEGEETAIADPRRERHRTAATTARRLTDVTVTITDDDTRGVAVSSRRRWTFTEGGRRDLHGGAGPRAQPTGTVTVTVGDTSDDIAASPETLTFTTANWNTAQTVTVTADDDSIAEGEETATLTHAVSGYGTVTTADSVTVTIADNDTAGVTVSPTAATATEGGATGNYTVTLKSQPTGTVTVTVGDTSDDIAASPETLTFTTANWNTAQTVTVTADDDSIAEGEETATLTHAVSGYGTVTTADSVTVTIADNDTAGVTVSPTAVDGDRGRGDRGRRDRQLHGDADHAAHRHGDGDGRGHERRHRGEPRDADLHDRELEHRADSDGDGGRRQHRRGRGDGDADARGERLRDGHDGRQRDGDRRRQRHGGGGGRAGRQSGPVGIRLPLARRVRPGAGVHHGRRCRRLHAEQRRDRAVLRVGHRVSRHRQHLDGKGGRPPGDFARNADEPGRAHPLGQMQEAALPRSRLCVHGGGGHRPVAEQDLLRRGRRRRHRRDRGQPRGHGVEPRGARRRTLLAHRRRQPAPGQGQQRRLDEFHRFQAHPHQRRGEAAAAGDRRDRGDLVGHPHRGSRWQHSRLQQRQSLVELQHVHRAQRR